MLDTLGLWEVTLLHGLREALAFPALDAVMKFITHLGDEGLFWIAFALILLLFKRTRRTGVRMAVAMLFCFLFGNLFLKPVIARTRPYILDNTLELLIAPPEDFSFPSGHTMNSISAAVAFWRSGSRFRIIVLTLAVLIAFSRLYLTVHYPSDVLAGAVIGVFAGIGADYIMKRFSPDK